MPSTKKAFTPEQYKVAAEIVQQVLSPGIAATLLAEYVVLGIDIHGLGGGKKEMTEERREKLRQNAAKARAAKQRKKDAKN